MSLHLKILGVKDVKDLCIDLSGNSTVSALNVFEHIKKSLDVDVQHIQLINKGRRVTEMQTLTKDDKLLVKIKKEFKSPTRDQTLQKSEGKCSTPRVPCETSGCNFYGTASTQNMCSVCFKKKTKKQKLEEIPPPQDPTQAHQVDLSEIRKSLNDKSKCRLCNKRVGLLGFVCNCGSVYCASHRHVEQHQCEFDYKTQNSKVLGKSLTKVVKNKVESI